MQPLRARLEERGVVVGDGAMGTFLMARGHGQGRPLEELSVTRPDLLEDVAQAYVDAGAEIVQTNTFAGSPLQLGRHGLEARTETINRAAVRAARRAVGDRAWVTASCGPCGRHLLPFGDLERADLEAGCRRQLRALAAEGVDAFSIETVMDVEEALVAIEAAHEVAPDVVVMASLVFNRTPDGYATPFGTPLAEAVTRLASCGIDVVGTNCSTGMGDAVGIARQMRETTSMPLLVRPNAGLPAVEDGRTIWPETPERFAAGVRELLAIGVSVLGGCCGTTPDHVRAIRQVVDEWRSGAAGPRG